MQGDAGRDILVADRDQQPHHAVVGAEQAEQTVEREEVREAVDIGAALGEVGVDEIAERRDRGADQDRREAPDPPEQIAAEADPDHRHEDAEHLRRERDLVLRIMEEIEIEGESEGRPDIVAKRVGQDEADDDQHAPAEALRQFGQRRRPARRKYGSSPPAPLEPRPCASCWTPRPCALSQLTMAATISGTNTVATMIHGPTWRGEVGDRGRRHAGCCASPASTP